VPDVRNVQKHIAEKILNGHGFTVESFGDGDVVVRQSPEPGRRIEPGDAVKIILAGETPVDSNGMVAVPDLRGMSVRRAVNRLVVDDLEARVEGVGVVMQQVPAPGVKVPTGTLVHLRCEPRPILSTVLY
jgi:beta-lactam-binding protein with PASTA domain